MFKPKAIYFENKILEYPLGKELMEKYKEIPKIEIENHNNIEEMRKKENKEFPNMKRNLIIGIRKTHKFVENHKTSDYLVPYTSSGCTASGYCPDWGCTPHQSSGAVPARSDCGRCGSGLPSRACPRPKAGTAARPQASAAAARCPSGR